MRFEAVAVDHIDRPFEQAGDALLEARIFEHGQMRRRIDLDHDVEVAVGPAVAARHRAEYGRPPPAARAGRVRIEGGFRGLRCGSCLNDIPQIASAQDGSADSIHFVFDGDLAAEFVTCF
jgi:hypothetical protein